MQELTPHLHLTLKRKEETQYGLFGKLFLTDERICHTLERPWLDNQENKSCIPAGEYVICRWNSPHHGDCFIILGDHKREDILTHKANWVHELLGCVAVGMNRNNDQLFRSKDALDKLKEMIPRNVWCRLTITNPNQ
jgi:hypothetical protein